jgi:broad specificity phosphatase PhoE
MKKPPLPTIRHLPEVDDLRSGRDGEIQPGQESVIKKIAEELTAYVKLHDKKKLVFIHSPKKRVLATAQLTSEFLSTINPEIKVEFYSEPNLKEINHGVYILPAEYKAGDFFEGFEQADKIFWGEVFGKESDTTENFLYKYGDPVKFSDGTYKHPVLAKYFSQTGENFKEALSRIYTEATKFSRDYHKYYEGYEPVMFAHGLPLEIYKDLSEVAEKVITKGFTISQGKLPRVCYQHHLKRNSEEGSHGRVDFLPLEDIVNPVFQEVLMTEIEYLERLN